jgi:DNA repair protein RecN (Recombination protein N)
LRQDARATAQRIDMLQFQLNEIGAAGLREGEEEELREERTRLANAEALARYALQAVASLSGSGDDLPAAVDLLGQAEKALSHLAKLDPPQEQWLELLQGLSFQLSELSADVQDYQNRLEFDPRRLGEVEERLELIGSLKRKYGATIADVLAVRERAIEELQRISHSEVRSEELRAIEEELLRQIGVMGEALSLARQAAADRLSSSVESHLNDLQMSGARFAVVFERQSDSSGAYVGDERVAFDASGIDQAEFVISANPGEPLKSMVKVASGGETARLMLALKTALAQVDETPTLIFDEIDQGIGGRVGDVVGRKLWGLTAVGNHQVIVVTHLPQLAGYGDVHFHVSKHVVNERTMTSVSNLDVSGRVGELAAMLGTTGEHAVGGAQDILRRAHQAKHNHQAAVPT